MSFKNKLNKMKSFLFDEEEVKEERKVIKPVKEKKEEKKVNKLYDEDFDKKEEKLYFEDISDIGIDDSNDFKSRSVKSESEFKFQEFDDDDFVVTKPREIIEPVKPIVKEEPKVLLYQGSKRKEETKKFKPSPIISPIYGLLDKDGNEVKKDKKQDSSLIQKEEISLDDIRKKAYGSLDDELENTMKTLSKKTIEEAEKDMEKEELELSRTKQKSKKEKIIVPTSIEVDDEDDDMLLPNVNFKEIDIDKERNKVKEEKTKKDYDDEDDDTKEQDLFNLIDTMYSKEGKED